MGYIKKVVDTGAEFADKYEVPTYVMKARGSSKIIDVASEKIESFYCETGSPLLDKVDALTAAKINTALAVANHKVEQAKTLKTAAAAKVSEKKTEAIEIANKTKATAYEKGFKLKGDGIAKYEALKLFSAKKADETKTIMRTKAIFVSEEACRLEKTLEMKLKEKAGTNEYANKVLSVVIKAKEQVKIYGDALVKKSCSLPLTLQERMEKGLSFAKDKVKVGTAAYEAKRTELVSFVKMSYGKMYGKMTSANALVAVRSVFGDKAASFTDMKLKELKKANIPGTVSKKMTEMYKSAGSQVGKVADEAMKMEEKLFGTSFIFKARYANKAK
jgi:hypothetical protein